MYDDPIVDEVRKVREQLAAKFDFNVHAYFEELRQRQTRLGIRLVKKNEINENDETSLSANQTKELSRGR